MFATVPIAAGLLLLLDNLTAGEFAAATVGLFINDVDPGRNAVAGDFDAATFTTSAALPVTTWAEAFINARGNAEAVGTTLQWDWDSGVAETVYGVVIKSAGVGTPLLAYARLENPKTMQSTGDSLAIVPRLELGGSGLGAFAQVSE